MSVYFIEESSTGNVKIGSARDVQQRRSDLQVGNSSELVVVGTLPGGCKLERTFQRQFEKYKIRGEWYRPSERLWEAVRREIVQRERVYDEDGDPYAGCDLERTKTEYHWVVECCPFCGSTHIHGSFPRKFVPYSEEDPYEFLGKNHMSGCGRGTYHLAVQVRCKD